MQTQIIAKLANLDFYWKYLNIVANSSSPYYLTCSQNDITKYKDNYNKKFSDKKISKADIVQNSYNRDHYDGDLAFECLSLGVDFNFKQNKHVIKIAELLKYNDTLTLKKEMYQKNFDMYEQELDRIVKSF